MPTYGRSAIATRVFVMLAVRQVAKALKAVAKTIIMAMRSPNSATSIKRRMIDR